MPTRVGTGIISGIMKNRIGVIVLVLIALGLGIVLVATKKQSAKHQLQDAETNADLSNNLVQKNEKLDKQRQLLKRVATLTSH